MRARGPGGPSGRTALALYVLLVVLPAACFGGLLWRQLGQYQTRLLSELPLECRNAAERLSRAVASRLLELRDDEMALRPFEVWSQWYYEDDGGRLDRVKSPLAAEPLRDGILGYFSFRVSDFDPDRPPTVQVLRGSDAPPIDPTANLIADVVGDAFVEPLIDEGVDVDHELLLARNEGWGEKRERLLTTLVNNVVRGDEIECREALEEVADNLLDRKHAVYEGYFHFERIDRDPSQPPWIIAYRTVIVDALDLPSLAPCLSVMGSPVMDLQGFVIDPVWVAEVLPASEAQGVLGPSMERLGEGAIAVGSNREVTVAESPILPQLDLGPMGRRSDAEPVVRVMTDASQLRRDLRVQNAWFAGMALILTVSMAIGIKLLLGSIRVSREEAQRTRNFVASVTHELRTPIAAVKLYGEMLKDGWVSGEERRQEYLQRIVTESDRLDGLVDRVLMRRKLYDGGDAPSPGDLSFHIEQQRPDLELVAGHVVGDLRFELAEGLPQVLLATEGIHVVVQNLVENARKYAPPPIGPDGEIVEPIVVRTRLGPKGRVLLEVLDRGPGIAEKDRGRIFEAFRRLGDEATRNTKGTGLGLHLVALQAAAMRARVTVLPREGGGSVFQVAFRRA